MPYKNLILIDDDEDDHEIFLSALQDAGVDAKCQTFTYAQEALRKLTAKDINPEVIFLDLNMPVMNGKQFLKEIKKVDYLKDIPVIVLSTSSNSHTVSEAMELGAKDFVTKPDKFNELVRILKTIIM